ncbi:MAG: hypothetical protein ISR78_02900 [Spirochaetia bacterium]|nr:hypothetical protein [Spirochaetia bacterium]
MIKKRISFAAVFIFILLGIFSSCNIIKSSATIKILLVEDQDLSMLNSENTLAAKNSEYTRAGLLIFNTGLKTASFIPIFFSRQFSEASSLDSVSKWIEINFALKIDYSSLLSGKSGMDLYEVIDSLTAPAPAPDQKQIQNSSLLGRKDMERWNTVLKNAELFLQDEVFKYLTAATGSFIPEKTIQKFISMYTEDTAKFYYMRTLVIDINSVTGYLYEREYIQQTIGEYN